MKRLVKDASIILEVIKDLCGHLQSYNFKEETRIKTGSMSRTGKRKMATHGSWKLQPQRRREFVCGCKGNRKQKCRNVNTVDSTLQMISYESTVIQEIQSFLES